MRTESARRGRSPTMGNGDFDGEQLRGAMAQLSDRHRAVICRAYYLRQTTTQIAAEFGTKDDVVKNELHHALHALCMTLHSAGKR